MNNIKRFQAAHTISREMYLELNEPRQAQQIIKGEAVQRLTEQIYNEMASDFYVESNPFVNETHIIDIVAMPTASWKKIERFLTRNKFDFDNL